MGCLSKFVLEKATPRHIMCMRRPNNDATVTSPIFTKSVGLKCMTLSTWTESSKGQYLTHRRTMISEIRGLTNGVSMTSLLPKPYPQTYSSMASTLTKFTAGQNFIPRRCMSKSGHYNDNVVSSPTLDQLDRFCEKIEPLPRPLQKVAVLGAASDIGQITCLFLKQQEIIKRLAMYDELPCNVVGICNDLAHIDTSTAVEAYLGLPVLKDALHRADVVLICGGFRRYPPCCNLPERDLFYSNARFVRSMTIAVAEFCPKAILCIQVPPVDATYSLARTILKQSKAYDPLRLLGLNSVTAMRANQLYCDLGKQDPSNSWCPCVGGTCYSTRVPVFSIMNNYVCLVKDKGAEKIDEITRFVKEADILTCQVTSWPPVHSQGHLSEGFATARAITNIMRGMFAKGGHIDSALCERPNPEECYGMKICATPLVVHRWGVSHYHVPTLNPKEMELLEAAKPELKELLQMGKCYARGEEYLPPCAFCCN